MDTDELAWQLSKIWNPDTYGDTMFPEDWKRVAKYVQKELIKAKIEGLMSVRSKRVFLINVDEVDTEIKLLNAELEKLQ